MAKVKRQTFSGEWYINNSGGRQGVRNSNGQNIIMENGDVMFVLDSESSVRRVFTNQSHFMKFQGDLVGHHCIYPKEPGNNKVCQPAVKIFDLATLDKLDLHDDLLTDPTSDRLAKYRQEKEGNKGTSASAS